MNKQRANIVQHPGPGRPKGSVNRTTAALKEALLEAFDRGGGVDWLLALMKDEPKTFASLLSRLIPTESKTEITTNELTDDERRARIAAILDAGRARRDGHVASGGAGTDDDSLGSHPA